MEDYANIGASFIPVGGMGKAAARLATGGAELTNLGARGMTLGRTGGLSNTGADVIGQQAARYQLPVDMVSDVRPPPYHLRPSEEEVLNAAPRSTLQQKSTTGIADWIPPKSPEIGSSTTIAELMESGAFPGPDGVVLKGPHTFADLYNLATRNNRTVEFGLGHGRNGETYIVSGGLSKIRFPDEIYPISHTHPNVNKHQAYPSSADLDFMQERVTRSLLEKPRASIPPHYIIWSATEPPTGFSPLPRHYFLPKGE